MLKDKLSLVNIGRDKLFRILRANDMLIKPKRSYHLATDSHDRLRKYKNVVCRMEINKPEQIWPSEITYKGIRENPSYSIDN